MQQVKSSPQICMESYIDLIQNRYDIRMEIHLTLKPQMHFLTTVTPWEPSPFFIASSQNYVYGSENLQEYFIDTVILETNFIP